MGSREITTQVRLTQWNQIIHDRNESGLTIADYCTQHDLSKNAYYYWLRKIREAAIESGGIHFSELRMPSIDHTGNDAPVIVELNTARIYINDAASRDIFSMMEVSDGSVQNQT